MPDEPKCTICGAHYSAHTAGPCRWCGLPLEHHAPGRVDECRAGKARMAAARRHAGQPLTDTDRLALKEPARASS